MAETLGSGPATGHRGQRGTRLRASTEPRTRGRLYSDPMVWPRPTALAAALAAGALLVASLGLAVGADTSTAWVNLAVGVAVVPLAAALGVLVTRRRPGSPVGALLALVGLAVAMTVTRETAWQWLAGQPELARDLGWLYAALDEGAWWVLTTVALLLLYFPNGRLPGARWRWVPAALVAATAAVQVGGAFDSGPFRPPLEAVANPLGPAPAWLELVSLGAFVTVLGLVLAAAWSLVLRHRRGDRLVRQQVRWIAVAGLGVAAYPLLCLVEILVWGRPLWMSLVVGVTALAGIPVATAVAVLRHDLYDVDKLLASTVAWALVSLVLVVLFTASAFAGGLLLGRGSAAAAAAATAVCAVALAPLRRRTQRLVDDHLYPLRRAAREAVEELHRDTGAGRATPEELERVLRAALRDPQLRVGLRMPGTDGYVDVAGAPVDPDGGQPVLLGGARIGVIVPGADGASAELMAEVAEAAVTMVEVSRLRRELASALREVESSRARLVQIGYDERRRLERDLHDGAQQRLVSLGMAIRLAQRHIHDGTVDVEELLDECVAELGTAVAELRQIAHGIRPSSLDDGLPAALARLVRSVPVSVEMDVHSGQLPDDVATTAYFVVSEAVTNAVKHADASRIALRVERVDGSLLVHVADDGCGGATLRAESGLADRVAALGGSLAVASPAGRGTVVEAALPCAS
jgi:signal transduction histidine kinase